MNDLLVHCRVRTYRSATVVDDEGIGKQYPIDVGSTHVSCFPSVSLDQVKEASNIISELHDLIKSRKTNHSVFAQTICADGAVLTDGLIDGVLATVICIARTQKTPPLYLAWVFLRCRNRLSLAFNVGRDIY